ncbi:glutaredoxin family protein [Marinibactrum halimedae]|uniref:Glutaredoxin family protein n=1 Tax=Marinibactrum halimedae TaxID=1444977 RepID=A0AA37TA47_9GAMM|nr:glutaredoxin family protein [Marinibactrum halimedae]MCD9458501.1 glutaredoxin family protein [Marinibactrum halimedae]GLS26636.1 glutaredoxin family protein [Marinibactrum halimedae]
MTAPNPPRTTLYLLTTLGCHLCEKAKQQLWPILSHDALVLEEVEIADNPSWVEAFGTSIPVVSMAKPDKQANIGSHLNWPFTSEEVAEWLSSSN